MEYRARERRRKRESRRQASVAQPEKGWQRSRAREKKKRRFFVGRTTWKFCSGGNKMKNASGHQSNARWKWTAVKKVNEKTCDISLIKSVTEKVLEVSRCSRAKQRQRNGRKKCAARAKLLFCLLDLLLFFTVLRRCLRRLALHDSMFCLNEL